MPCSLRYSLCLVKLPLISISWRTSETSNFQKMKAQNILNENANGSEYNWKLNRLLNDSPGGRFDDESRIGSVLDGLSQVQSDLGERKRLFSWEKKLICSEHWRLCFPSCFSRAIAPCKTSNSKSAQRATIKLHSRHRCALSYQPRVHRHQASEIVNYAAEFGQFEYR